METKTTYTTEDAYIEALYQEHLDCDGYFINDCGSYAAYNIG